MNTEDVQAVVDEVFEGLVVKSRYMRWEVSVPGYRYLTIREDASVAICADDGEEAVIFDGGNLKSNLKKAREDVLNDLEKAARACGAVLRR